MSIRSKLGVTWAVDVTSTPDLEKLRAEVWHTQGLFAYLEQENGLEIVIFSRDDGEPWRIPFDEVIDILEYAKSHLFGEAEN